jgi:hypothetical protein
MKYVVVNMVTKEQIIVATRTEGRALAEYFSVTTPHLWYLMMVTE